MKIEIDIDELESPFFGMSSDLMQELLRLTPAELEAEAIRCDNAVYGAEMGEKFTGNPAGRHLRENRHRLHAIQLIVGKKKLEGILAPVAAEWKKRFEEAHIAEETPRECMGCKKLGVFPLGLDYCYLCRKNGVDGAGEE